MNTTNTPDRDEAIADLKRWAKDWHPKNAILESALALLERDREAEKRYSAQDMIFAATLGFQYLELNFGSVLICHSITRPA